MNRLLNHTPGHKYRLCRKCDKEWNVSRDQNEKVYICPQCAGREKKREKANELHEKSKA